MVQDVRFMPDLRNEELFFYKPKIRPLIEDTLKSLELNFGIFLLFLIHLIVFFYNDTESIYKFQFARLHGLNVNIEIGTYLLNTTNLYLNEKTKIIGFYGSNIKSNISVLNIKQIIIILVACGYIIRRKRRLFRLRLF